MDKKHTLVGEAYFREMLRPEEEQRQRLNPYGGIGDASNVVSLQDYRQRQAERRPYRVVPLKPST